MDALTIVVPASVLVIALLLIYLLIRLALHRKGNLRAGAKIGQHSFFLEVRDKERGSSSRAFRS